LSGVIVGRSQEVTLLLSLFSAFLGYTSSLY
jgi:hypothetical protein